ncbi:MAG: FAD-dependent oxidoreductase [Clostridiales bacterium]|nr:FAD-dependent oxidoreductase [Clostridiales bacterium]
MSGIERYPNLFKPLRLGNTYFRNRIFSAPTGLLDLTPNCAPSFDHLAYFERKAKGGAASINIGESIVCDYDSGDSRYDIFLLKDRKYNYNGLAKLADAINRQGAVATIELQHPGAASRRNGTHQMAPSDGPNPLDPSIMCRAMTEEDIYRVIDEFSEAALYAKTRGFGMVQIHGGHGWLINQFFSPFFNKRTDRWGGSVENRARFGVAVIDEIHRKCGKDFPVEIRISGSELFEGGYGIEGGIDFAKQLEGHADLIHVSVGNPHDPGSSEYTHPGIFKEGGCNVQFAAEIKKHVSTPVATVGGLSDPDQLEEIIASGKADVVEMARGLICDPDLPVKLRSGREKEVRRCLRCFRCVQEMYQHGRLFCAINPESGKDREILSHHCVPEKKHVLVAGGGIAGMEAAITAAENGHKVTLCEKTDRLGGVLLCETGVYFKKRVGEYIERQKYMIEKKGVEVRLNTPVTPELVNEIKPDALIAAIGGKPIRPNIPGIDGANVISVEEAFAKPELVKGKALIIGAGRSGTELGIYLKELGKEVSLIEAKEDANQGLYAAKIAENSLETSVSTMAKEIRADGVLCDTADGEKLFPAETVILALGVKPLWEEVDALSSFAGEFYQAGDCRKPRSIMDATGEAWTMANLIGRY